MPAATRDAFLTDLGLAQAAARSAKVPSRVVAEDNTWIVWRDFCLEHNVDPLLATVTDPIPYFQVFGQRYRDGRLAKDGKPVYARTVEDAMRQIGQTMASLGAKDHRLIGPRQIDFVYLDKSLVTKLSTHHLIESNQSPLVCYGMSMKPLDCLVTSLSWPWQTWP